MEKTFDFAFFPEVRYDHLLRGRTGALIDNLQNKGFYIYYFERPPDSPLQYFKDPIAYNRGLLRFLFPIPIINKNMKIFPQPPIFPAKRFNTGLIKLFNRNIITHRIKEKYVGLIKIRNKPVVAFVSTPWWYDIIRDMEFTFLCYDCIDDLKVFCEEKEFEYFNTLQKQLVKKSDLILISAQRLKEEIQKIRTNTPIVYLQNGADAQFFIDKGINAPTPEEIRKLPKPIVGFIGSLFGWIDMGLIAKTAQAYPKYSFVLVGPVHEINIPKLPNIYHLGPKPYSQIPAFVNAFDVCLIPFIADSLSGKVDPIKVYEYLALGKPVVAINLPELEKMKDLIYLAKDNYEFINMINQAVDENNPLVRNKRIQYAKENSWDMRVNDLIKVVTNYVNKKFDKIS